jgi:hypothetical protein
MHDCGSPSSRAPITRVDLIADHRLRLLPPADDSPIAWYESTRGSTQIIHLEFKPPHQQEIESTCRSSWTTPPASGAFICRH